MSEMKKLFIKFIILLLLPLSLQAFSCGEIVGESFFSPGDSDFQYDYSFEKKGLVKLKVFMTSHDTDAKEELKIDQFQGKYKITKKAVVVKILVDGVAHEIHFSCLDNQQYMGVGPRDRTLKVSKTIPVNHSFSMIDLWPKKSKIIRRFLSK